MKQQTQTPEATPLHTQGEWQADGRAVIIPGTFPEVEICVCTSDDEVTEDQAFANAELIVKAVNERQALLDSHSELSEVLETVYSTLNNWNTARNDGRYNNLLEYMKPKLNNANNINK